MPDGRFPPKTSRSAYRFMGRGFESESALRKAALQALQGQYPADECLVLEEFEYAAGRADAVLVRRSERYLEHRLQDLTLDHPIACDSVLRAFLRLHRRGEVSLSYARSSLGLDSPDGRRALEWLIAHGFIVEDAGNLRRAPGLRPHVTTATSVEFKLSRWQRALFQAHRTKAFTHHQYVLMDEAYIHRSLSNRPEFEDLGVGLMSVSQGGDFHIHLQSRRCKPYSPLNVWRLNEASLKRQFTEAKRPA